MANTKKYSYFDTSLMLTLTHIFPNNPGLASDFLIKKEKAPVGKLRDIYSTKDNSALVRKIFRVFIKHVLEDIIAGNGKFILPGRGEASIYMGTLNDKLVKYKRKRGLLQCFDMLATNYTVPYLKYSFSPNSTKQHLCIYVNKNLYGKLIERANTGEKFSNRPKNIESFLPFIYDEFSCIQEHQLEKLIKYCFKNMVFKLRRGEELRILDKEGEIRFFRPLGKIHDEVMKKTVERRTKRKGRSKKLKKLQEIINLCQTNQ